MDDADRAQDELDAIDALVEASVIDKPVYVVPPGVPGDCELCGRWSGRLILGACAPCRDRYRLE